MENLNQYLENIDNALVEDKKQSEDRDILRKRIQRKIKKIKLLIFWIEHIEKYEIHNIQINLSKSNNNLRFFDLLSYEQKEKSKQYILNTLKEGVEENKMELEKFMNEFNGIKDT